VGKAELSGRSNWQEYGGTQALIAEQNLYSAFIEHFKNSSYVLIEKPNHLRNLYAKVRLSDEVLRQIYNPDIELDKTKWGVSPDFAIQNTGSGKILFGEIKRQDGWVEGKDPAAGRGNAHERLCKLFTPGLLKAYRHIGKISTMEILPFWVVFQGDITRDPKRNREVAFWFDKYDKNYFMWRPNMTAYDLTNHFDKYLRPYLE